MQDVEKRACLWSLDEELTRGSLPGEAGVPTQKGIVAKEK